MSRVRNMVMGRFSLKRKSPDSTLDPPRLPCGSEKTMRRPPIPRFSVEIPRFSVEIPGLSLADSDSGLGGGPLTPDAQDAPSVAKMSGPPKPLFKPSVAPPEVQSLARGVPPARGSNDGLVKRAGVEERLCTGIPSNYCKDVQRFIHDIEMSDIVPIPDHCRITSRSALIAEKEDPRVLRIDYREAIDLLEGASQFRDTEAYRILRTLKNI